MTGVYWLEYVKNGALKAPSIYQNTTLRDLWLAWKNTGVSQLQGVEVIWICSHGTRVEIWPYAPSSQLKHPEPESESIEAHTCVDCGETIEDDGKQADDGWYCESCFDKRFATCERCEETASRDDLGEVHTSRRNSEYWCEDCRDRHTNNCTDCGNTYSDNADGYTVGRDWLCEHCYYSGDYGSCATCGEIMHSDDLRYSESREESYCSDCLPDESNEHVHDYSYKPSARFYGGAGVIHYGIELEVSTDMDNADAVLDALGGDNESHVYLKEDGSISDHGFEIVTHPHTLAAHRDLWSGLFSKSRLIRDLDASGNGMHVHIQRKYLTALQIQKMVVFLNRAENERFVVAMADRDSSRWARLIPSKRIGHCESGDRYEALNLCNSHTVELRIFRGTVKASRFFANLEFADALVSFTRHASCHGLTVAAFAAHVRANRKAYLNLDKLMVSGGFLSAVQSAHNLADYKIKQQHLALAPVGA